MPFFCYKKNNLKLQLALLTKTHLPLSIDNPLTGYNNQFLCRHQLDDSEFCK